MSEKPNEFKTSSTMNALWEDQKELRECSCSTTEEPVMNTRAQYAQHLKTDADGKNPHNIKMEKRKGVSQK
jgi:hypothetical protein